ncbi:transglycosylase SLT domain-containing protein [bacterium]|nr:transglycosylase SLT domain-containing protein [bacterium]
MSLKIKVLIISFLLFVLFLMGALYCYADFKNFDNKKQYQKAEQLYKEKNYQEAYVAFLKIRYFSRYRNIATLKQAITAEHLNDWSVAESKYEKFLKKSKKNSFTERAEYSLAKAYYMNKNYDKAVDAFLKIKKQSTISDYRKASDFFLGKISFEKNLITPAKKYFLSYIKNVPTGRYSLQIAFETMNMVLKEDEAVLVSKIFLANQKYDEALIVLKDVKVDKAWTYKAIAEYYKNNIDKFKSLSQEGFSKYSSNINREDLINFTDFYLSMQKDYYKSIKDLQKQQINSVIPDYFAFKNAQNLSYNKKIEEYKLIVKKFPKSAYIPECLISIFYDFGKDKKYNSAIKVGKIYLEKFPNTIEEPEILFWTGKYLQKLKKLEEAKIYYDKIINKYPSSYYAFRASRAEQNQNLSWLFDKKLLPKKYVVNFPMQIIKPQDKELAQLFLEVGDYTIWEEIPFDNLGISAWLEYKKGNVQKSIYLANKYILDSKTSIPYNNPVWKLAFPIYYSQDINMYSQQRNLDPFLILSLIREESHFNPKAISSSNAIGLMQLLIPTASYIAEMIGAEMPTNEKLQNAQYNIMLGTAYFSHVLDVTENMPVYAIGGYNGGPNAMNSWKKESKAFDLDDFVENIPYFESKNYIKKVYRSRYNYSQIY